MVEKGKSKDTPTALQDDVIATVANQTATITSLLEGSRESQLYIQSKQGVVGRRTGLNP